VRVLHVCAEPRPAAARDAPTRVEGEPPRANSSEIGGRVSSDNGEPSRPKPRFPKLRPLREVVAPREAPAERPRPLVLPARPAVLLAPARPVELLHHVYESKSCPLLGAMY